jgi:putative ABC transport system permease protein
MVVAGDFFSTYQVDMLSGRDFSRDIPADGLAPRDPASTDTVRATSFILNELAAREFGWTPEEAVGKEIYYTGENQPRTVIGVVNNTLKSSKDLRSPVVFAGSNGFYPYGGKISLRISTDNLQETLKHVDLTWAEFFPEEPISRVFLQDQINAMYRYENQQARLFRSFALLSIILASMGLLGLAAFNSELRTKEIGVRKVMGGSVFSIVLLLTNDFSKLVLVSNLIAGPVAYFAMNRWLESFAYRIDLTPFVFIGSGLIAFSIAWVTVGCIAAMAATAKPVLTLRHE